MLSDWKSQKIRLERQVSYCWEFQPQNSHLKAVLVFQIEIYEILAKIFGRKIGFEQIKRYLRFMLDSNLGSPNLHLSALPLDHGGILKYSDWICIYILQTASKSGLGSLYSIYVGGKYVDYMPVESKNF